MRIIVTALLLIFILGIIIYLNRSYGYFYDFIKQKNLPGEINNYYEIKNSPGSFYLHNTITYVALGDSLTSGVGASAADKTYPYQVAQSLTGAQDNVRLFDYATPGAGVKQVLLNQLPQAVTQQPNLVTILIGINDIHNQVTPYQFRSDYQTIITKLKNETSAKIVLINIPFLGSSQTLLFPHNLLIDFQTIRFNAIVRSLARENNLVYIDLYSSTKPASQNNDFYSSDYFHPSDKGYKLWAKIIDDSLYR